MFDDEAFIPGAAAVFVTYGVVEDPRDVLEPLYDKAWLIRLLFVKLILLGSISNSYAMLYTYGSAAWRTVIPWSIYAPRPG